MQLLRRLSSLSGRVTTDAKEADVQGDVESQLLLPPLAVSDSVSGASGAGAAAGPLSRRSTSDFDEKLCVICYDRLACTVRRRLIGVVKSAPLQTLNCRTVPDRSQPQMSECRPLFKSQCSKKPGWIGRSCSIAATAASVGAAGSSCLRGRRTSAPCAAARSPRSCTWRADPISGTLRTSSTVPPPTWQG